MVLSLLKTEARGDTIFSHDDHGQPVSEPWGYRETGDIFSSVFPVSSLGGDSYAPNEYFSSGILTCSSPDIQSNSRASDNPERREVT